MSENQDNPATEKLDAPDKVPDKVDVENAGSALEEHEIERLTVDIVAALKTVYDPEIPSDIYEIGLI